MKLLGRACVDRPVKLLGRNIRGRPIGNCIFWVDDHLCLGIPLWGAGVGGKMKSAGQVSGTSQLGLQWGGSRQVEVIKEFVKVRESPQYPA